MDVLMDLFYSSFFTKMYNMTLGKKGQLSKKTKKNKMSFMPHAFNQSEHPLSTVVSVDISVWVNLLKIHNFL
jgi:hypothetical protein